MVVALCAGSRGRAMGPAVTGCLGLGCGLQPHTNVAGSLEWSGVGTRPVILEEVGPGPGCYLFPLPCGHCSPHAGLLVPESGQSPEQSAAQSLQPGVERRGQLAKCQAKTYCGGRRRRSKDAGSCHAPTTATARHAHAGHVALTAGLLLRSPCAPQPWPGGGERFRRGT